MSNADKPIKYKITFTLQKEVSVIVEIADKEQNNAYDKLGAVTSNEDFIKDDLRWDIEQIGYDAYSSMDDSIEESEESIVNRSILRLETK